MRATRILFAGILFMSSFLAFCGSSFSHTFWINASKYSLKFYREYGAETKLYFGWGHRYPVDDYLNFDELEEFSLHHPDGREEKLSPEFKGFLATSLNFKEEGGYIVSAAKKPVFYTMYVEDGKIHHKFGPKTGVKGIILSLYSRQYAKTLIMAGSAEEGVFSKPVGHKLEIIPLRNPYKLKTGDFLPVKILFENKPARFCKVYGTYSGFSSGEDFAYATSTDSQGIAKIRILHWSSWLIKANVKIPASGGMKDKCDNFNYTATLTFEIP